MEMMAPGKYILTGRDDVTIAGAKSKSTFYYPGVRDRNRAKVITVAAGNYVRDLEIRLPQDEKRYRIAGTVLFSDGFAVKGATIEFASAEPGYAENTTSNADGSFALTALAGVQGQLKVELPVFLPMLRNCPEWKVGPREQGMMRFIEAPATAITMDEDRIDLTIELPSPSCKAVPAQRP
ncbi:MAG: carboxypeptidase-like regulatory domain-containing protein [Bryobacteraceae bacterium]